MGLTAGIKSVRLILFINLAVLVSFYYLDLVNISSTGIGIGIFLYVLFGCVGVVATYHRGLSHHTYEFKNKFLEIFCTLCGALSGSGSSIGWVAVHRRHHEFPDTPRDPHSPVNGIWNCLTVKYNYDDDKGTWYHVRDLVAKRHHMLIHRYYFPILLGYIGLLGLGFGLDGIYYGFSMPSFLVLLVSGITNTLAHTNWAGYKNYQSKEAGDSVNVWWLAWLNFGESWHNNHHEHPENFTTQEKPWEIDMAGEFIKLVKA